MNPEIDKAPPEPRPYEATDAAPGATLRGGLLILAAMFGVAAILVPLYWLFVRQESGSQERPATVIQAGLPPETIDPRLVTSEPAALAAFRAREDFVLDGYGWVEEDRGIARMPVAQAIRMVGERGALPAFAAGGGPASSARASGRDGSPSAATKGGVR